MRKITKIIVHCSDSEWGDAEEITKWHVLPPPAGRGWSKLGYHYVILNGYPTYFSWKNKKLDKQKLGVIEDGTPVEKQGIHCAGDNHDSIGICLIGKHDFDKKVIISLYDLLTILIDKYDLNISDIYGHYERPSGIKQGKTCPNIDMEKLRKDLILYLARD